MKFSQLFKSASKKILKKKWFQEGVAFLAAQYIRFVYLTSQWVIEGTECLFRYRAENRPLIVCFWHGRLFILCAIGKKYFPSPFYMLMSDHSDGGFITRVCKYFNIHHIPGSSRRKGAQAMRAMLKTLRQGNVIGITPEGLRGPYQVVGEGLIRLAHLSQCDVFPVAFATSKYRIFPSWDRFFFAFPFSRGALVYGPPISPQAEPDPEKLKAKITEGLLAVTARADQLCGVLSP